MHLIPKTDEKEFQENYYMGGICGKSILRESNSIVPTEEYAANSSIDAKIIQILHDKKVKLDARKDERKQSLTFDAIILKFKIVEDAFLGMKDTYEKFKDVSLIFEGSFF